MKKIIFAITLFFTVSFLLSLSSQIVFAIGGDYQWSSYSNTLNGYTVEIDQESQIWTINGANVNQVFIENFNNLYELNSAGSMLDSNKNYQFTYEYISGEIVNGALDIHFYEHGNFPAPFTINVNPSSYQQIISKVLYANATFNKIRVNPIASTSIDNLRFKIHVNELNLVKHDIDLFSSDFSTTVNNVTLSITNGNTVTLNGSTSVLTVFDVISAINPSLDPTKTYFLKYIYENGSISGPSSTFNLSRYVETIEMKNDNASFTTYSNHANYSKIQGFSFMVSDIDVLQVQARSVATAFGAVTFTNYTYKLLIEELDLSDTEPIENPDPIDPENPINPIFTVEEFSLSGSVWSSLLGYTSCSGGDCGYVEVPGLYQFSDILLLAGIDLIFDENQVYTNALTEGSIDSNGYYYNGELIIWVTPGKLHFKHILSESYLVGATLISNQFSSGLYFEYIYRTPGISGQAVFITNVDNPISESVIRASITAYDETDGDITHLVTKTSDTFTANKNTVGEWEIVYSVTDSSNNISTLTVHVFVRDIIAPEVNPIQTSLIVSYNTVLNGLLDVNNIPSTYEWIISDNYSINENINIIIVSDDYTINAEIPGIYAVVYSIQDESLNSTSVEITITVVDDIGPSIFGPTQITTTTQSGLTLGNILAQYSAIDDIDGDLSAQIQVISDTFSANKDITGDYLIVLRSTDLTGNITNYEIIVTVSDNVAPVFYVTAAFISVEESISLTLEDIIRILYVTGQIDTMNVNVELNTYSGNSNTPGTYTMLLSYGAETLTLTINVTSDLETPTLFAITFNSNGGSIINHILIESGMIATVPTSPTRSGYVFAGWFKDQSLTISMDWDEPITSDMMLYAKWTPNNGGTPITDDPTTSNILVYVLGGIGVVIILGAIFSKKKGRY